MKIVVDENIIFGKEAFSEFGDVYLINGRNINRKSIDNADYLIVRSVTPVNKELLQGTNIKFIGTATIGTDHIDLEYLKNNGITFASAKGCNSYAVAEYVLSAISYLYSIKNLTFKNRTLGVVGVGNIGSKVAAIGTALGFSVLKNDPPLQRKANNDIFCDLKDIYSADIITLHVPLTLTGRDKTYHLFDESNINKIKKGAILINTSRGQVVDNIILKKYLSSEINITTVLDVWENEPDIDLDLLKLVAIGTPHIAGYSLEGKVNGTIMIYNALCKFLNIIPGWKPRIKKLEDNELTVNPDNSIEQNLFNLFRKTYPVEEDDRKLRVLLKYPSINCSTHFDNLRKSYIPRRELLNYSIKQRNLSDELLKITQKLRIQN